MDNGYQNNQITDNQFSSSQSNEMPNVSSAPGPASPANNLNGPIPKSKKSLIWEIAAIILTVLLIASIGFLIWLYSNYQSVKSDVDGQIATAVAAARKEQSEKDEQKFAEREKSPYNVFVGLEDYGRVTFNYPKTWSQYVAKEGGSGKTYEVYLNPGYVMAINNTNQYALRVIIEQKDYDKAVAAYASLVKNGDLSSSLTTINNNSATRLDGQFSKDARGSLVLVKIRDKTLSIRTDAEVFKPDFDKIIKTIKFNQ